MELGQGDAEVNALRDASSKMLNKAVEQVLHDAVAAGEMRADTNIADAVAFIASTLSGMKVSAKAGAGVAALKHIAHFAIKALQAR